MKAILIDPSIDKQSVEIIEFGGELQNFYDILDCSMITAPVAYDNLDTLFADDEAWLHKKPSNENEGGFIFPGWLYAIFGKAIIVGTDDNGNPIDCKTSIKKIQDDIQFLSHEKMIYQAHSMGIL